MALYGWALFNRLGVPRDVDRGQRLVQQSTHIIARAMCLLSGFGVMQSFTEAYRVLSTECDTSDPQVQCMLGGFLLLGQGCTIDPAHAIRCYERAGNHVDALLMLGVAVHSGLGLPEDFVRAVQLYRQAAEQGYADAQYSIGIMYADGEGVSMDRQQARHWLQMAADQGHQHAKSWCDSVDLAN
eukprot:TRINITY_DN5688_c2_g1_i2.p1 TRINITY_DN5688_c2_g1~~TRINITY_DN5688_c2_g1_i2.p1  ORF type:complete len:184 (+),score=30.02 TRINITY_DN5688_c2_g1_i2:385-936(+)